MDGLILLAFILGIVLTIAWIVLPFAIIGTKPLLRELIAEVQETNALLQQQFDDEHPAVIRHNRDG